MESSTDNDITGHIMWHIMCHMVWPGETLVAIPCSPNNIFFGGL